MRCHRDYTLQSAYLMATFLTGNIRPNCDNFISSYTAADHMIIAQLFIIFGTWDIRKIIDLLAYACIYCA